MPTPVQPGRVVAGAPAAILGGAAGGFAPATFSPTQLGRLVAGAPRVQPGGSGGGAAGPATAGSNVAIFSYFYRRRRAG